MSTAVPAEGPIRVRPGLVATVFRAGRLVARDVMMSAATVPAAMVLGVTVREATTRSRLVTGLRDRLGSATTVLRRVVTTAANVVRARSEMIARVRRAREAAGSPAVRVRTVPRLVRRAEMTSAPRRLEDPEWVEVPIDPAATIVAVTIVAVTIAVRPTVDRLVHRADAPSVDPVGAGRTDRRASHRLLQSDALRK